MEYAVYKVVMAAGDEAALTAAFSAAGFTAYALSSRHDGRIDVELYGAHGVFPDAVIAALGILGLDDQAHHVVSERSLLENVLDGQPCEICPGVWVDPAGTMAPKADDLIIHIPPSPAFGDGHHPSTRMAADILRGMDLKNQRVLDLGCGTGVLGILAYKQGAETVYFSDIDEGSVRSTKESCQLNGFTSAQVVTSDLLHDVDCGTVEVVIANLYADLLLLVAADPKLTSLLPHGQLLISGVAQSKRQTVEKALHDSGFTTIDERSEAWWNAVLLKR